MRPKEKCVCIFKAMRVSREGMCVCVDLCVRVYIIIMQIRRYYEYVPRNPQNQIGII